MLVSLLSASSCALQQICVRHWPRQNGHETGSSLMITFPPPLEARQLAFGQLVPEPSCQQSSSLILAPLGSCQVLDSPFEVSKLAPKLKRDDPIDPAILPAIADAIFFFISSCS